MKIAAVIMVKNESLRIVETIDSVQSLDGIVLYDTGSTDDTIEKVKQNSKIPVHVKCGTFVDFATSRNEALDFADTCGYDYYLLLDSNDQLQGTINIQDTNIDSWYVEQKLKYSETSTLCFQNIKVVKASAGLRYKGKVHEYLDGCKFPVRMQNITIFQDKTLDDNKSELRWIRDRVLLEKELQENPNDPRTLYYLAQTYECLGLNLLAFTHYCMRTLSVGGFEEERWQATYNCGKLCEKMDMDPTTWYLKAISLNLRSEPLVRLANYYASVKNYMLAYTYAHLACLLSYPKCLLFVEKSLYDYERWHVLGIVSYYAAQQLEGDEKETVLSNGKNACIKAIDAGCNVTLDSKNLEWY